MQIVQTLKWKYLMMENQMIGPWNGILEIQMR